MAKTYTQAQRDADIEAAIDELEALFQVKLKMVFEAWDLERCQTFALGAAIERQLRAGPDKDSPEFNAWKLAEVVIDMLGCTSDMDALKRMAGVKP